MITMLERYQGCLVGLAVGDALGAPVEFCPRGSFDKITDLRGGGPFNLQRGQYTDDTSMALCLAESLFETGGFDPIDQLRRYVRWYREGYHSSTGVCFDIGNTTRAALEDFERTGQPYRVDGGAGGSNGSIMRLAPVALAFARSEAEAIHLCGESSRTTHNFQDAVDACRVLGAMIVRAVCGVEKEALLRLTNAPGLPDWNAAQLSPIMMPIVRGEYRHKPEDEVSGSSHAAGCLEAALWAFDHSSSFEEGALQAVNLGDDADSTGAVYGQMAGAYYGLQAIPASWREVLWDYELLLTYAKQLYEMAGW